MANTITSYVTFAPNTKARSTEVNNNFSNHRGDLIPINADTASGSDSTHDLGTSSHRWKDFYLSGEIKAKTSLVGRQDVSKKSYEFLSTSSTIFRNGQTAAVFDVNTTEFFLAGITVASMDSGGILGGSLKTHTVARSKLGAVTDIQFSTGTGALSLNTISATDVNGMFVSITTALSSDYLEVSFSTDLTTSGSLISFTGDPNAAGYVQLYQGSTKVNEWFSITTQLVVESFRHIIQINTGGSTSFSVKTYVNTAAASSNFSYVKLLVRRL